MKFTVAFVSAAMLADLLTFALVVPLTGIGAELNPIMRNGYITFGVLFVALLKAISTLVIIVLVSRCEPGPKRWFAASIGIFIGLVGAFGNTTAWMSIK